MLTYPVLGMSQEYVLFRSGVTLEVSKWKFDNQILKVTQSDGAKKEFPTNEVDGIIYGKKGKVKYFRNLNATDDKPTSIDKIAGGAINLYLFTFRTAGQYGTTISELYFEKGDFFGMAPSSGSLFEGKAGRQEKIEWLKRLMSNQVAIVDELSDPEFKPKFDNLVSLVKKYNLLEYSSKIEADSTTLANCIFYLKRGNEIGTLTVNDSFNQKITSKTPSVAKASHVKNSKVCVKMGDSNFCTIFKVTPHFVNYFELSIEDNQLQIELKHSNVAQSQMLYNRSIKL